MSEDMNRRQFLRTVGVGATAASLGAAALLKPERAVGQTRRRTVQEFLAAVGQTAAAWPPIRDFYGWSNAAGSDPWIIASVDYSGYAAAFLKANGVDIGTQVDGVVTERPLKDGSALVRVEIHTKNALSWAGTYDGVAYQTPLLFGCRAKLFGFEPAGEPCVLDGGAPALGEAHFTLDFVSLGGVGAPFPDVNDWSLWGSAYQIRTVAFAATAVGELRALAGVPDGTPGRLVISQRGLLNVTPAAKGWDGFPAELVALHPIR